MHLDNTGPEGRGTTSRNSKRMDNRCQMDNSNRTDTKRRARQIFGGRQHIYLIASDEQAIAKLPDRFNESNDRDTYLEQILDIRDGNFKDCFSYFTAENSDNLKPISTGAHIKARITVMQEGREKASNIFDASTISPSLGKRNAPGANAFAIEATDGITTQKASPIRKHRLLAAFGFETHQVTQLVLGEETN